MRRSTWTARVALAAGALVATLAAAEALLHTFDLPRFDACSATAEFADTDPELGFVGPPDGIVADQPLNAVGLRGPLLETPKPEDRFRILFIGDSTCWGLGLPVDDAFPARTTELLGADHPGSAFEFLIGAFPGYSSYQSRIQLARLLPMEPDLVVFYVGARNDSTRHRYFEDADIPARRARLRAAWHQVRLLRLGEALWDRLYKSVVRKALSYESRARVPLDTFRSNVEDMAAQLERAGVPGLVVVPPLSAKLLEREPIAPHYREVLREIARAHDVPVVELQPAFEAAAKQRLYFGDGFHFAAGGHAVAAQAIRRAVNEHVPGVPAERGSEAARD